jgi:aspartyl-tRNA synthetase
MAVSGAQVFTRSRLDDLTKQAQRAGAAGLAWFKVVGGEVVASSGGNGLALDGPLSRHLSQPETDALVEQTGAREGDLLLAVSDEYRTACEVLGTLRSALGSPPVGEWPHRYVWVVDFPMFEGIGADGNPQPAHHPFTMPYAEDLPLLTTDPLAVRSQAYDLVLNGWELGSGSVRIHRRDIQSQVFAALGIGPEEAEARFGFLLGAFRYGAPPHAGFAFGIDRLAAILAGEENIREVIAYPKTQSGADPLTGAPTPVPPATLAELGIRVVTPPGPRAAPSPG